MFKRYTLCISVLFLWTIAQAIYPLPPAVIEQMGTREMRYHHLLWHNVRNTWNQLDSAARQALTNLGWGCPRPSQTANGVALENNDSGEDFLYMHREMIRKADEIARANPVNPPFRFRAWDTIPRPRDINYGVPPEYDAENVETTTSTNRWKTDDIYYNYIVPREARWKDPNYLRTLTLGQFGSIMEYTLHNGLHMRWSEKTDYGLRMRPRNPVPNVDSRWDSANYTWLIDSYASATNPYFYKIHLWIDERLEDWRRANGLREITWKGTWVGGPMSRVGDLVQVGRNHNLRVSGDEIAAPGEHHHGEGNGVKTMEIYEEVFQILEKAGVSYNMYDPVR